MTNILRSDEIKRSQISSYPTIFWIPVRVLLDESVPRQLADHLGDHDVTTVPKIGWAGFRNGELMAKAAAQFDAFITADKGIEFQ